MIVEKTKKREKKEEKKTNPISHMSAPRRDRNNAMKAKGKANKNANGLQ